VAAPNGTTDENYTENNPERGADLPDFCNFGNHNSDFDW